MPNSKATPKKWSGRVTKTSNALDLKRDIFKETDPKKIASSLKASATKSKRKKGTPYQSAMSMLNFYINRAGHNLPEKQKDVLEKAKEELKGLFDRE
jgi:putative cell wall-binding protein